MHCMFFSSHVHVGMVKNLVQSIESKYSWISMFWEVVLPALRTNTFLKTHPNTNKSKDWNLIAFENDFRVRRKFIRFRHISYQLVTCCNMLRCDVAFCIVSQLVIILVMFHATS